MARKITILELLADNADAQIYRVVFWLTAPTGREPYYADGAKASVMAGTTAAPTTAELAALRDGKVVEVVDNVSLDKKSPTDGHVYTLAEFNAAATAKLQAQHTAMQGQVDLYNPRRFYGTTWSDENGWVVKTLP